MDATALYWPDKAAALGDIARESARLPKVRELAAALGLGRLDGRKAAATLAAFVGEAVAFVPEQGDRFERADRVLASGGDDCDGHAVLAAALATAAGLRARIVGLRWRGEAQPVHVRAEVGAPGLDDWHSADSTVPPGLDLAALEIAQPVAVVSEGAQLGPVSVPAVLATAAGLLVMGLAAALRRKRTR